MNVEVAEVVQVGKVAEVVGVGEMVMLVGFLSW